MQRQEECVILAAPVPFSPAPGEDSASVQLEQLADDPTGKHFRVLRGFVYTLPDGSRSFTVPVGMKTDLASVPWGLWWLVASYGRHTRAALVHDALIDEAVVERKYADFVFLTALEDPTVPGPRGSWTRHQLMWIAVCLFGTMRKQAPLLMLTFVLQLLLFWVAVLNEWWVVALVVGLAGLLWSFDPYAVRQHAWKLWPLSLPSVVLILPATFLVYATAGAIWLIEAVPSKMAGRGWPPIQPTRFRA